MKRRTWRRTVRAAADLATLWDDAGLALAVLHARRDLARPEEPGDVTVACMRQMLDQLLRIANANMELLGDNEGRTATRVVTYQLERVFELARDVSLHLNLLTQRLEATKAGAP